MYISVKGVETLGWLFIIVCIICSQLKYIHTYAYDVLVICSVFVEQRWRA